MGQRKEYTFGQQLTLNWSPRARSLFGVKDFAPPTSDCPADRYTITDEVASSAPIGWPDGWANLRLDMHAPAGRQIGPSGALRGWPIQRYAPDAIWDSWTITDIHGRITPGVQVPRPLDPPLWLEGHPLRGGGWDAHWLGVCPERQEAIELIHANPANRTCWEFSRWQGGVLVEGRAVCRAGVSLTARLWGRDDRPHRLCVHIAGDDKVADTHFPHPTTGDVFRLSSDAAIRLLAASTTDEQRRWLYAASAHGLEVVDRTGAERPHMLLATVADAGWAGHSLGALDVRMADLELVTR